MAPKSGGAQTQHVQKGDQLGGDSEQQLAIKDLFFLNDYFVGLMHMEKCYVKEKKSLSFTYRKCNVQQKEELS